MSYETAEDRQRHAEEQRRYRARHLEQQRQSTRRYRREHPEKWNAMRNAWRRRTKQSLEQKRKDRANHPEMVHAWEAVYKAVKSGRLIRPDRCQVCGLLAKVQAHHADYTKKLEVTWLCRICHLAQHNRKPLLAVAGDPERPPEKARKP